MESCKAGDRIGGEVSGTAREANVGGSGRGFSTCLTSNVADTLKTEEKSQQKPVHWPEAEVQYNWDRN